MAKLDDLRVQIDDVDKQIVALLDKRAGLAKEIGAAKQQEGRTKFYDASRQKKVVENAIASGAGVFPPEAIRKVFVEVMSASLALERAPRTRCYKQTDCGPCHVSHLLCLHPGSAVPYAPVQPLLHLLGLCHHGLHISGQFHEFLRGVTILSDRALGGSGYL